MINNIGGYELSENQKNLWSISKNQTGLYYNQIILEIQKDWSVREVLHAIQTVTDANTILRYNLIHHANFNYPFQIESDTSDIDWKEMDGDIHEVDAVLDYPYDPSVNNPARFCLVKQSGKLKFLAVRLYAVFGDIYSCFYLCNQLGKILSGVQNNQEDGQDKIDYINYSAWQNDLISKPEREAIVFWKNASYHTSEALFPFSEKSKSFQPAKKDILTIDGAEYGKIKDFCASNDCEAKTVFLSHFVQYLQLFSENEVTVGVSDFKRDYEELEHTLGLVSKSIPLAIGKQDGKSLIERVKEIEAQRQDASEWTDFFTLNRKESAVSEPLRYFNYGFEFIDLPSVSSGYLQAFNVAGLFSTEDLFDLKMSCIDTGSSISVGLYYNQACLKATDIAIVSGQIRAKYLDIFQASKLEISFPEKEIIEKSNTTSREFAPAGSIIHIIEEQAKAFPGNTALFADGLELDYAGLHKKSDQFRNYLIEKHNVRKGDAVCVVGEGTDWFVISILGIIKAGAYYIPIDSKYPKERIDYILKESNCSVLVCDPENGAAHTTGATHVNPFDAQLYTDQWKDHPVAITPEDLVYCIYTSGSTGNPKGCTISHGSLLNYIQWANEYYFETPNVGNWGLITSISFDLTVTALFTSLTRGKKLWLGDFEKNISELLSDAFANPEIDTLKLTPSHISLVKELEIKETTVRRVICGGEQLLQHHVDILKGINPEIRIYNEYGPTETTVGCIVKEIEQTDSRILIGKPIANTAIYIADENTSLCPIGVKGEIYIAGKGLTNGYLNRMDLTEDKIIESPFIEGEKLYKSGDLACWLPNGEIEYFGRIDDQVKIKGFRIELGEIEQLILNQEHIRQAVVVVKERENEKYLVAYYAAEKQIDKKTLQNILSQVLPEYMVPGYYVQLEAIPLTSNGKADKKALLDVEAKDLIKAEYIAPRSQEEKLLVSIWSEVLKHEAIGIKDNFFHLGGDSIKSIQVVSRLKQQGYVVKVEQILRNPLIEELAKLVQSNDAVADQAVVEGEVPLTPIQQDFFANELITNKNHFNQSVVLKSREHIDPLVLEASITALVLHHDALRMTYQHKENAWSQYNQDASKARYEITFYDLRQEANELQALQNAGETLQSGFDLTSGALFRIGHFRMSDGDRLALVIHHLLVDGVSWRILLEDLTHLYTAIASGNDYKLAYKTDSYQRWSTLLKAHANSGKMQKERMYWEEISHQNITLLPTDQQPSNRYPVMDASASLVLDAAMTQKLQTQVHHVYNSEINDVLLTGLGLAIREVFAIEKTVVRMEGHGREEILEGIDTGRTVGWFTSLYPFVLDLSNAAGNELVSVKESLRKIPYKGIGYGILDYLEKPFENPLASSIQFNYLGDFGPGAGGKEENPLFGFTSENIGSVIGTENKQSDVLFDIVGMMVSGQLHLSIKYATGHFRKETVQKLVSSYEKQLQNLIGELAAIPKNRLTPSDLTYKKLDYATVSALDKENNIEDVYELSPLQQGFYFQWLMDPSSSMYFEQSTYIVNARDLSVEAVRKAYNKLISRYSILRTSFTNDLGDVPLQIVHKEVEGHFSLEEMTESNLASAEAILDKIKEEDRAKGFNFEKPSLMRLKVVALENGRYAFIWSHHHILMDGWCMSILINDFNAILASVTENQELQLPEPVRYAEYIKWLSGIDQQDTLTYWKKYLQGMDSVSAIPFRRSKKTLETGTAEVSFQMDGALYQNIKNQSRELGITQNIFVQGVWGYLLSSYNNRNEAVFGSVVSGRPGELPGVEQMVGLFTNTIPVRVSHTKGDSVKTFLRKLHAEALESTPHHYTSLSDVQLQSPLGTQLITSIIAFENFVASETMANNNADQSMVVEAISAFEQTNYDFNVIVSPSASALKVTLQYNPEWFDMRSVQNISTHFLKVAEQFASDEEQALEQITYVEALADPIADLYQENF